MTEAANKPRILILTYGTRGDVEPFIALALGLQGRGYGVTLATAERYGAWVGEFGVPFQPISNLSIDQVDTPDGQVLLEGGSGLVQRLAAGWRMSRKSGPILEEQNFESWQIAQATDPDLILFHPKMLAAPQIAEALDVPAIMAVLQPTLVPTAAFPPLGLPALGIPGWNRFAYRLVSASYAAFKKPLNRFRRDALDLPPVRGRDLLSPRGPGTLKVLHAISPHVVPRPPDWPAEAKLTGYWRLSADDEFEPPDSLAAFLAAGPPPVYVGFGSMTSAGPGALLALVKDALRSANVRGIVSAGWAGLASEPAEDVMIIDAVPHAWLFPRMAAVVHHGGAGTTAAGFHAGVPCVICPFIGDQPGWARLSVTLGVGAEPVPRGKLTAERLGRSIATAVTDPALRRNAQSLASKLAAEDGVANAIAEIEQTLAAASAA